MSERHVSRRRWMQAGTLLLAGFAVGAGKGYVYIRSEYPDAIRSFSKAVDIAEAAGLLGVAAGFEIEVRTGAGAYVCGEETSLLESLEGRRGQVRAKPPLPAHKGLFGRPTVINNLISLATSAGVSLRRASCSRRRPPRV